MSAARSRAARADGVPAPAKPRALKPGDRIGLVAPSGSLKDPSQADKAAALLGRLGFEVAEGPCCRASYGYLAGKDAMRAAELNSFFADPSIAGIVCLKGGYGAPRILDSLDYGAIRANPKPLVGYSDITGIHLALSGPGNMVSFHGPMGVSDSIADPEGFSARSWLAALMSTEPLGPLEPPEGSGGLERLVGGVARGPIIGGNLSLVAALTGTPYALDARGKIIFLEDIDEAPYRVDRMLTQLRLAGVFEACAGVLLGDWNNCVPEAGKKSLELADIFQDIIAPSGKPLLCGFRAGHCSPAITIPFGVRALLDADARRVEILEAAAV